MQPFSCQTRNLVHGPPDIRPFPASPLAIVVPFALCSYAMHLGIVPIAVTFLERPHVPLRDVGTSAVFTLYISAVLPGAIPL